MTERTSETCQEHDLQEFDIEDVEVGINFPPLPTLYVYSSCAVIEGLSNIGKRAAKDENGKTYYVRLIRAIKNGEKRWLERHDVMRKKITLILF